MRRYFVFATTSGAMLLAAINMSTASVAFPAITEEFNTSVVMAGWVLTAFLMVSTVVMPLTGKISELLGKKNTFIIHASLFTVGSVLCAVSSNIYLLIASRVLQGCGSGGFLPCATGIVSDEFPEARQRFIGLFASIMPVGMIIGPNVGGWLVESFGWRSIFWFNLPLGIGIIALSKLLLKVEAKRSRGSSIDFAGAGLLFGAVLTMILGLTEIGDSDTGVSLIYVGVMFAASCGMAVLFLRRERRVKEPIVDLELLRHKQFLATNIYNLIYGVCALGVFSIIPLFAVSVYDLTVFQSGAILTPRSIGTMVASAITSFQILKWGYRKPILAGTLVVIASLILLALQPQGIEIMGFYLGPVQLLIVILCMWGVASGVINPVSNNACIELMPDKVATITGLRGMFRSLGAIMGIAVSTIIVNSISDVNYSFYIVMLVFSLIMLATIPAIFIMPASPNVSTLSVQPSKLKGH